MSHSPPSSSFLCFSLDLKRISLWELSETLWPVSPYLCSQCALHWTWHRVVYVFVYTPHEAVSSQRADAQTHPCIPRKSRRWAPRSCWVLHKYFCWMSDGWMAGWMDGRLIVGWINNNGSKGAKMRTDSWAWLRKLWNSWSRESHIQKKTFESC